MCDETHQWLISMNAGGRQNKQAGTLKRTPRRFSRSISFFNHTRYLRLHKLCLLRLKCQDRSTLIITKLCFLFSYRHTAPQTYSKYTKTFLCKQEIHECSKLLSIQFIILVYTDWNCILQHMKLLTQFRVTEGPGAYPSCLG